MKAELESDLRDDVQMRPDIGGCLRSGRIEAELEVGK
jgi:hypothetical protein